VDAEVAEILELLSEVAAAGGEPSKAIRLLRWSLAAREMVLGPAHPDLSPTLKALAANLRGQNDPSAEKLETRVRELEKRHPGNGASNDATVFLFGPDGRCWLANSRAERALVGTGTKAQRASPEAHLDFGRLCLFCASDPWVENRVGFREAQRSFKTALELAEHQHGQSSEVLVPYLLELADLYSRYDDRTPADPLLRRAFRLVVDNFGDQDERLAPVLNMIADLQGNFPRIGADGIRQDAPQYHHRRQALDLLRKSPRPDGLQLARTLDALGLLDSLADRKRDAEACYREALTVREAILGPDHPAVLGSLLALATFHHNNGNHSAARSLFARALETELAILGPLHADPGSTYKELASCARSEGHPEEALAYLENALECFQACAGPGVVDPIGGADVPSALEAMADAYRSAGNLDEAERILNRVLALRKESPAGDKRHLVNALRQLGDLIWEDPARRLEAAALYEQLLPLWQQTTWISGLSPEVPQVLLRLADARTVQGDVLQAQKYFEHALGIWEMIVSGMHSRARPGHFEDVLVSLFDSRGRDSVASPLQLSNLDRLRNADRASLTPLLEFLDQAPRHLRDPHAMTRLAAITEFLRKEQLGTPLSSNDPAAAGNEKLVECTSCHKMVKPTFHNCCPECGDFL
jgi:tetratricopeptide (TPR) repeat protein